MSQQTIHSVLKSILVLFLVCPILTTSVVIGQQAFITTWQTDAETPNDSCLYLPFQATPSTNYNIDWDNDGTPDTTGLTGPVTLKMDSAGVFTIQITGTYPGLYFVDDSLNWIHYGSKLLFVEQWGDNAWDTLSFERCSNFNITAIDTPDLSNMTSMRGMFREAQNFNSPVEHWDVSTITDMSDAFAEAVLFNQPLNGWDVSNVTTLRYMFEDAPAFNQPLHNWDVSNVTDMHGVFSGAENFNQPLNAWDVSNVTDMSGLFSSTHFNYPLSSWDVSNVVDFSYMFSNIQDFNQNINGWDVSSATHMEGMFSNAQSFNQPLDSFDVSSVTLMNSMFFNASSFDQDISEWDVSNVTQMTSMFNGASVFNQDISGWDVSNVLYMGAMFMETGAFNQNLSSWAVDSVTNMGYMFYNADAFNQPVNSWDVGNVEDMSGMFAFTEKFNRPLFGWDVGNVTTMENMFAGAEKFNRPLHAWDVSNVESMIEMFAGALAFDQDLGDWDVSNVDDMYNMFFDSQLSTANYDSLLIGWSSQSVQSGVYFHGGNSQYCAGEAARAQLISSLGWNIMDGGRSCPTDHFVTTWTTTNSGDMTDRSIHIPVLNTPATNYAIDWTGDFIPDTSGLTGPVTIQFDSPGTYQISISGVFASFAFDGSLPLPQGPPPSADSIARKLVSVDQWGTTTWDSLSFKGCENLNFTAVDTPDLSGLTSMRYMFARAETFNSPIEHWDVSGVTDMGHLFCSAWDFNQPLGAWDVSNVTNMEHMFENTDAFNQPLDLWDVSNVTNMAHMFNNADAYTLPLVAWDVSSVENMAHMFSHIDIYNLSLSGWDVSSVTNMTAMFSYAGQFNQSLADWDISSVTDMDFMLDGLQLTTANYDSTLISWGSQSVQAGVNFGASSSWYCQGEPARQHLVDAHGWIIDDVASDCMGDHALIITLKTNPSKNQNDDELTIPFYGPGTIYGIDWDNDGVLDTSGLTGPITIEMDTPGYYTFQIGGDYPNLKFATNDDAQKLFSVDQWGDNIWQELSFKGAMDLQFAAVDTPDLSQLTSMSEIFRSCSAFDSPINHWDVSNVTDMSYAFSGALNFNQPLDAWDVSNVTDMTWMFRGTQVFNQSIETWDVGAIESMDQMFAYTWVFDQNLFNWDFTSASDLSGMFLGVELSTSNYDSLLLSLAAQGVQDSLDFDGGSSKYCAGVVARNYLIDSLGWTITDGGRNCSGISSNWTGAIDTDWFLAGNWSDGVPADTVIAIIPVVGSNNYPEIDAPGAECSQIIAHPNTSVTVKATGVLSIRK